MSRVTNSSTMKDESKKIRYRGIVAAARDLKVTRQHLWEVLSGRRQSKRLLNRYENRQK